jgi:hypothetical protein
MPDKSNTLILEGLSKAVADPLGAILHGAKGSSGLFPNKAAGKQAANHCKEEGFLRILRTETKGKTVHELCALTEKGWAYLLSQVSPRQILEQLAQVLAERQSQIGQLVETARSSQATFEAMKSSIEKVLAQLGKHGESTGEAVFSNGSDSWKITLLSYLVQWQTAHPTEDCPLPDLFQQVRKASLHLTIGQFHDGLRQLYEREQIYLHPWTGPLYDLPEPPFALLVGHEIAYYASLRQKEEIVCQCP